jgi:Heavy metal binding domain
MKWILPISALLIAGLLWAQAPADTTTVAANTPGVAPAANPDDEIEYVCPMDKDVRSKTPGRCLRCGMQLKAGTPDPVEYPLEVTAKPAALKAGVSSNLTFVIGDPRTPTAKNIRDFEIVHEKLYHLFVVSQDLSVFQHIHPQVQPDGTFKLDVAFPKAGMYRLLSDFYPKNGTPQLIATSMFVQGDGFKLGPPKLEPILTPQKSENLDVDLVTDPPQPIVGEKTLMFFRLRPNDGIEPYIGAMGHMLAVSSDMIDMIHAHPFLVTDPTGQDFKQIQFNMIFPREGIYRVWIQFQRKGVVNTVAFNIPVTELR